MLFKKEAILGVNVDDMTKVGVFEVIRKENIVAIDDLVKARLEVMFGVAFLKSEVCLEWSFFLIWIMSLMNWKNPLMKSFLRPQLVRIHQILADSHQLVHLI